MGDNDPVSNPYAPPDPARAADRHAQGDAPADAVPPQDAPAQDPGDAGGPSQPHQYPPPPYPPHQYPPHQYPLGHVPPGAVAPVEPPPVDPEAAARVRRTGMLVGGLLIASVLASTLRVPWSAVSGLFTIAAVVMAVRGLVQARRARVRGTVPAMMGASLAVAAVWGLVSLGMLALWPAQAARQECLDSALTVTAQRQCERQFEQDVNQLRDDLEQRSAP